MAIAVPSARIGSNREGGRRIGEARRARVDNIQRQRRRCRIRRPAESPQGRPNTDWSASWAQELWDRRQGWARERWCSLGGPTTTGDYWSYVAPPDAVPESQRASESAPGCMSEAKKTEGPQRPPTPPSTAAPVAAGDSRPGSGRDRPTVPPLTTAQGARSEACCHQSPPPSTFTGFPFRALCRTEVFSKVPACHVGALQLRPAKPAPINPPAPHWLREGLFLQKKISRRASSNSHPIPPVSPAPGGPLRLGSSPRPRSFISSMHLYVLHSSRDAAEVAGNLHSCFMTARRPRRSPHGGTSQSYRRWGS
ncbi:hypothetical protein CC78DRAFT_575329 [Lojkania enalia]|uniref:Uncharacterized protein n=1 Tax=Lojkania enalia TaxID=147567 RepID=A0A9P4TPR1_9PLEO|nr:hypothetical protein CC78DRAFT_575329 [Didymosphaeria enalia]